MNWKSNIKLIINADDFGLSNEVNIAINECFKKQYIDRTTILVNMPGFDEAVQLSKSNGYFHKVGLHLNLVEGIPLSENVKNTGLCTSGTFNRSIINNKKNRFFLNKETRDAVRDEIIAQVLKYKSAGFPLMHIDSHQHSHTNLSVIKILLPIIKANNFKSIRLSRNIPSKEIKGLKLIYKMMVNKRFIRYNMRGINSPQPLLFGSMEDIAKEMQFKPDDYYEMMVHPIKNGTILTDSVAKESIEIWLSREKNNIYR